MPFRVFLLSLWQLNSSCNFPFTGHDLLENPKAEGNVRKGDSYEAVFWTCYFQVHYTVRNEI